MARRNPELCQKIRARIEKWDKYWSINRKQYHDWTQFVLGNQWREDESKLFERYNKMPLAVNKLGALMNHLLGEQRQNTPNLQVVPESGVPEQTAEVRAALVKNISLDSHSNVVYQWAFQCAGVGGFGAYGIRTRYESPYSFNQIIELYEIKDPTKAYWDVSAQTPCKTDGMFAGNRTRMSRVKFRSLYGRKVEKSIGAEALSDGVDVALNFADDDSITIIDDYERVYETINIYQLSNGEIVDDEELEALLGDDGLYYFNGMPVEIEAERETEKYKIKHRQIAGDYILDESDFPSEQLPIVFVDQNSYWDKNGQQLCRPFFQDVKDSQRYLNYLATQSAYLLKISRYDQFLVSKANVKAADTQNIWRDPSTVQGGLFYDESPNGNKPEQLRPPELSQSLISQYDRTLMDIQTGTGMYNAQLGEQGNEISGRAIDSRSRRGSYNTYVLFDSLNRAIAMGGEIINEMIPKVYDTARSLKLKLEDGNIQDVRINNTVDEYGGQIENDMRTGRYKIRLMPGASFEGQKAEALESLQMLIQADPSLFKLIGDLYVENLPLANNIELRNRIKTIIPPEIIQAGKTGKSIQQPQQKDPIAEAQAAETQLKQAALQLKAQEAQKDYEMKMREFALKEKELQLKAMETGQTLNMDWQKLEAEKQEAAAKLQETLLRYQAEIHKTNTDAEMQHAENIVKLLTHGTSLLHDKGKQNDYEKYR